VSVELTRAGKTGVRRRRRSKRILVAAGFVGVSFTDVHEPVHYGPDVASALGWIRGFSSVNDVLQRPNSASTVLTP
jgi:hypothetical protein